jgi:signal transduction histidine kinase
LASFSTWLFRQLDAIAVVAIAICLFAGSLIGLSYAVDSLARARQELLIRNSLTASVREAATRVIGISDWDDAVRHLDNQFDSFWADQNVGQYFAATHRMAPSFVLDGENRPVYSMRDARHPEWRDYSVFAGSASPLVAKVRERERARGAFRPPFRTGGNIFAPIQEGGIVRARAGAFVIVASLVQPDFGKALPRGSRAPILIVCEEIGAPFLKAIGERLAIPTLVPGRYRTGATATIRDARNRALLELSWRPIRPGRDLVAIALLPILCGVLLLLALYFRGRVTAAKLRKTIDELATTRDTALNANRVKNEFLANMSHELRTPLNAILGFSEMLASDAFASHRGEYARIIHRSGAQLLSLVNDLLDLSRIEAGKLALHAETVDFPVLISECLTAFAPRCAARGIRLDRVSEGDIPLLQADRRALQQILLNLLSNAVKFTPAGKHIRIFVRSADGLDFGVEDEGSGIAEEDQEGVFERFGKGRHDLVLNTEGAGLGLPIVKGLVEAHGGTVSLWSRVGEGTRVIVHLPPACVMPSALKAA